MCNDDTYILNHLLFDDWFVSSIAPDLKDFVRDQAPDQNGLPGPSDTDHAVAQSFLSTRPR